MKTEIEVINGWLFSDETHCLRIDLKKVVSYYFRNETKDIKGTPHKELITFNDKRVHHSYFIDMSIWEKFKDEMDNYFEVLG